MPSGAQTSYRGDCCPSSAWWYCCHCRSSFLTAAMLKATSDCHGQQGLFRNDVVVRSTAAPLHTIISTPWSPVVSRSPVTTAPWSQKDALLFRLSNPQLRLETVRARSGPCPADSNLSTCRCRRTSQTEHQRRMLDSISALPQAEKQFTELVTRETGVIPLWPSKNHKSARTQAAGPRRRKDPSVIECVSARGVRQMSNHRGAGCRASK